MEKNKFSQNIYFRLFSAFFKLGLFTFGGGMAMVPLLQDKMCKEYGWMTEDEVVDCLAVSQGLPGVIAINMATYTGYFMKGLKGALAATLGMVLPSFIIIILVVCVLEGFNENPYVQGALTGINAASAGLILWAAIKLGKQVLKSAFAIKSLGQYMVPKMSYLIRKILYIGQQIFAYVISPIKWLAQKTNPVFIRFVQKWTMGQKKVKNKLTDRINRFKITLHKKNRHEDKEVDL